MTDAPVPLVQSNRALSIVCEDCNADIRPRFGMTEAGLRRLPAYCECGFMTPGSVDDAEPAESATGESVEAAA